MVTDDYLSPYAAQHGQKQFKYELNQEYTETCNTDETQDCAAGLHVATLDWCIINHQKGWKIIGVDVKSEDIMAIPTGTDGKIRVQKLRVMEEISLETVGLEQQN